MSLQAAANLLARHGREGDSVLVHMSPEEVRGLQQLAEVHGTTLTINPHTGMPEAFSLKSLLPVIAGMALNYFLPGVGTAIGSSLGTSAAVGTGIAVGGGTALATGSLEKGIMAGLGAYGGAGISEGLQGLGSASLAAGNQSAAETARLLAQAGEVAPAAAQEFAAANAPGAFTAQEAVKEGLSQAARSPGSLYSQMGPSALKYTAAAAAPVMAEMSKTKMPDVPKYTPTAAIHPKYAYRDQEGNVQFVDLPGVKMEDWKPEQSVSDYVRSLVAEPTYEDEIKRAADGGVMTADELAYQNDPVIRMADGGLSAAQAQEAQSWFAANPNATYEQALAAGSSAGYSPTDVAAAWSQFAPQTATGPTAQNVQSAYQAGDYGTAQQLGNILGWTPQDYIGGLDLNRAQAQNLANAVGYKGDLSKLDFSGEIAPLAYGFYGGVTDTGTANAANRVSATDLAQWMKDTGYTGQDINKAFAGNPDFAKAGVTSAQLSQMGISPTLSRASQWQIEHGGSFTPIDQSIDNWIRNNAALIATDPAAARAKGAADAAASGVNEFDVYMATGKTLDQIFAQKIKEKSTPGGVGGAGVGTTDTYTGGYTTTPQTYAPTGTTNPYGNAINPGDITRNSDGTITVTPNVPGRPYGGFTGMGQVRDAYTAGGGRLGQVLAPTKTYQNTGLSAAAYDYLMGKGPSPIYTQKPPVAANTFSNIVNPPDTEVMSNTSRMYVWQDGKMIRNPWYGKKSTKDTTPSGGGTGVSDAYSMPGGGDASGAGPSASSGDGSSGVSAGDASAGDGGTGGGDGSGSGGASASAAYGGYIDRAHIKRMALGGLGALAAGGHADLGDYSDGGRLLKGPGDGVSDSIPATIGGKRPARLADGEFVVPARIVSEIGNGSTEAGARKLYAMMERVQQARKQTVGSGRSKVAKNTRADKYLPV